MKDELFVPNDTFLFGKKDSTAIITGPNMAGKSTYMRQVALIALMAQMGSFVPAKSCRMGIVDKIFTRVGAFDDLSTGRSTYMVEMSEVAEIIDKAKVGRATFYAHFETKDYLLKSLLEELFSHVFSNKSDDKNIFNCENYDSVILHLFKHFQKNDNNQTR